MKKLLLAVLLTFGTSANALMGDEFLAMCELPDLKTLICNAYVEGISGGSTVGVASSRLKYANENGITYEQAVPIVKDTQCVMRGTEPAELADAVLDHMRQWPDEKLTTIEARTFVHIALVQLYPCQ